MLLKEFISGELAYAQIKPLESEVSIVKIWLKFFSRELLEEVITQNFIEDPIWNVRHFQPS